GSATRGTSPGGGSSGSESSSKAVAKAFVAAVNLKAADLPGFSAEQSSHESNSAGNSELSRCLGASIGGGELASGSSPTFSRKGGSVETATVQSNVSVVESEEQAKDELAKLKRAHTGECLARFVESKLRSTSLSGGKLRGVQPTQIAAPANSFGWRLTALLEIRKVSLPLFLELLGFVEGRAEVALTVFAFPRQLATSEERHLLELLHSRVSAQRR
ncbi:MAG: hypothetical protein ACYCX7_10140, partial [Solirubrobacteraceae bacterium]